MEGDLILQDLCDMDEEGEENSETDGEAEEDISEPSLDSLPLSVLREILALLPKKSIFFLSLANRRLHFLIQTHFSSLMKEWMLREEEHFTLPGMATLCSLHDTHNVKAAAFCQMAQNFFWKLEDINLLGRDTVHWHSLQRSERQFYAFMVCSMIEELWQDLPSATALLHQEVKLREAQRFYSVQSSLETVHSTVQHHFLALYVPDQHHLACLPLTDWFVSKQAWISQWLQEGCRDHRTFGRRLAAFVVAKRLFSCTAFCTFFWLQQHNLMEGLTTAMSRVARDRQLFVEFGCFLFHSLEQKPAAELLEQLIVEAVDCEKHFVRQFPAEHVGLNSPQLDSLVEYIANTLCSALGVPPLYEDANDLSTDWLHRFFPVLSRHSELSRSGAFMPSCACANPASLPPSSPSSSRSTFEFCLDADF